MCSTCGSDGVSHELKNDKSREKCVDWHCTFIKWKSMDKSKGVLVLVNPLFLKKKIIKLAIPVVWVFMKYSFSYHLLVKELNNAEREHTWLELSWFRAKANVCTQMNFWRGSKTAQHTSSQCVCGQ